MVWADLLEQSLIVSHQEERDNWPTLSRITQDVAKLNIVAADTLLFNESLLVEEGLGYAVCFDRLINTGGNSNLCFRPLYPVLETSPSIVWKCYQSLSKPAQAFLDTLEPLCKKENAAPTDLAAPV